MQNLFTVEIESLGEENLKFLTGLKEIWKPNRGKITEVLEEIKE